MNMMLAVRATLDSDKLKSEPVEKALQVVYWVLSHPAAWVALVVLIGCFIFTRTGGFGKMVMLAAGALLVIGWDSQRGVTKAAFGGDADAALMTGLLVAGAFALFRLGTKRKPAEGPLEGLAKMIPGMGGDSGGKRRRGRGRR
jgi:hypothetical protein